MKAERRKARVLIFTSLFPNSAQPEHGNFILERMRYLTPFVDMSVVAPVPYFPHVNVSDHWFKFSTIPRTEKLAQFQIDHPRYVVIPKLGMVTHGVSMWAGSLRQVHRILRVSDFDLIDAHYVYPDGLAAIMLGALFRKPVVVSARGSDINVFSEFTTIRPMLQFVLKQASKVIAVAKSLKDMMVSMGCPSDKIALIGNGIDPLKFMPQPKAVARQRLMLHPDRSIVVTVGQLNDNKGIDILVETIARLRFTHPDIMLIVIGEGPCRPSLEKQIRRLGLENHVRLVGRVAHAELSTWYSSADAFCLASLLEGCPNVVLEAMACGCPIVATHAGGVPDLIDSPAVGLLVERTPAAFEVGIGQALNSKWDHSAIVEHARSHSWENVAARLLDVYSGILPRT